MRNPTPTGASSHDPGSAVHRYPERLPPNSSRETRLLNHLWEEGITELVIASMMPHRCIDTNTRAAADLGFVCRLAHDACATKAMSWGGAVVPAPQVPTAFRAALDGAFAQVRSGDDLCAGL